MSGILRVVGQDPSAEMRSQIERHVPEHSGQFRFNFDVEPVRRIVLIPMDEIDGVILHEIVFELSPVAAMDLRHAVRFDLPGTNRNRFFGDLRLAHTLYIREPIEWHELTLNPFAIDSKVVPERLFHEIIEREDGHVMLLLPNKQTSIIMASALNLALTRKKTHGWRIEQAA
jgi:hypothetical protein